MMWHNHSSFYAIRENPLCINHGFLKGYSGSRRSTLEVICVCLDGYFLLNSLNFNAFLSTPRANTCASSRSALSG